ncbi:type I phosphomannose isomerase catalytic subunit [Clostridium sp.]|uniref:type I phosphomannose isomerase catalytic subunit n=1 Tax=Clostridium sp. TaxID=1506 RepID=UPI001A4EA56C|nr:type I phosphomannose isomerase catalytic subunit [Clostridium sp.]MBK5234223.1 class I mannose-6-phosphate isomerase [Clostridium sp.]
MYPIKFENLYYEKVWGGRNLEGFRENLPSGKIGESWDIACHANGTGIVANGKFKGMTFNDLINKYKKSIFGDILIDNEFPLLVKLINSNDKLSVQVHPNDDYAKRVENSNGKTEAWYVVDAEEGSELIVGTNGCTREQFVKAINEGNVEECLNRIKVKKGDSFLINSGLVHAICQGIVIAEIQQNSDITYRVYDYGRDREIHVEKSLEVIDFNLRAERLVEDYKDYSGYKYTNLCKSENFNIDKCIVNYVFKTHSKKEYFSIITCVDGVGSIEGENYNEEIKKGDSFLIPASLGEYAIKGNLEILISEPVKHGIC